MPITTTQVSSIRLRWALIVGGLMSGIIFMFALLILTTEEGSWKNSQNQQSLLLVDQLSDELSIPMLANSKAEVSLLIDAFLKRVPSVKSIELQWQGHSLMQYGEHIEIPIISDAIKHEDSARRLNLLSLWYISDISYKNTGVGRVAVRFSVDSWTALARQMKKRLFILALIMVLLSGIVIYWVAGRMSRPIELLAQAEELVCEGDFSIRLPVRGNDEISIATRQFNRMTQQLAEKERIREQFNRYMNPKLVEKLFADNGHLSKSYRQEVTVLFADMVQFTSYSQDAPAETVIDSLNAHFELFYYIVNHYGGNIDKYIGDAVMVVFNHPFEDEQHVRHAIMAGLCMEEACRQLAIERPDGDVIKFHIGLNPGEVIVGNIGARKRLEYTIIGDAVNVASRMASLGEGVMAAESVFSQLEYGFDLLNASEQKVKGVEQPIRCGNIVPSTRKNIAEVLEVVKLAMLAKEQVEREDSYFDDDYE